MNIRFNIIIAFALLLLPLIIACQSGAHNMPQSGKQPIVETLYASQQCHRSQTTPSATWIDNTRQLEATIKHIQGAMLGGQSQPLPALDFQHEIALLVEMGQRPTLGYQIMLTEADDLRITHNQARLTLDWIQPSTDTMVAQMISSPCLLLKLKRGNYSAIQILDRHNTLKAETH